MVERNRDSSPATLSNNSKLRSSRHSNISGNQYNDSRMPIRDNSPVFATANSPMDDYGGDFTDVRRSVPVKYPVN